MGNGTTGRRLATTTHVPLQNSDGLRALALRGPLHRRSNGLNMGKEVLLAAFFVFVFLFYYYCLSNLCFGLPKRSEASMMVCPYLPQGVVT